MSQMTKTSRPFMDKRGQYDYSSVQVNLPKLLAKQIIEWGNKHIADEDLYAPGKNSTHGREDEMHITILYGIHTESPNKVEDLLANQPPFQVTLNEISLFTSNEAFDVVKVGASSLSLVYLNQLLKNSITNTQNYPSYKPHVTIAYVKKGAYEEISDEDAFEMLTWTVETVIFSSKNGEKTPIRLNTSKQLRVC